MTLKSPFLSFLSVAVIATSASTSFAQENTDSGVEISFGLDSSLRVIDNYLFEVDPAGKTTLLDNTLTFGILSVTEYQRLSFGMEGILRYADFPNSSSDISIDDPDVTLSYAREGAFANFKTDAHIRRDQLNFTDPLRGIEDPDDTDLVIDNGVRENRAIGFNLELNTSGPFGVELAAGHAATRYLDTTDTRLFDSETNRASATAKLRLSKVVEGRVHFGQQDYTASDAARTARMTRDMSMGVTYAISPLWEFDAEIGQKDIETTIRTTNAISTTNSTTGSLRLTRAFSTGSASLSFVNDASITGERSTLKFSRSYATPNANFDLSIGATRGPSDDTDLIGSLSTKYTLQSSVFSASFAQSFATSTAGNDFKTTTAGASYTTELSSESRLNMGINYAKTSDAGDGSVEQIETYDFKTSYFFNLTSDWGMETGYIYRVRDGEFAPDTKSNEVFLTLSRSFSYVP